MQQPATIIGARVVLWYREKGQDYDPIFISHRVAKVEGLSHRMQFMRVCSDCGGIWNETLPVCPQCRSDRAQYKFARWGELHLETNALYIDHLLTTLEKSGFTLEIVYVECGRQDWYPNGKTIVELKDCRLREASWSHITTDFADPVQVSLFIEGTVHYRKQLTVPVEEQK